MLHHGVNFEDELPVATSCFNACQLQRDEQRLKNAIDIEKSEA